jgi:hypothetical protein
MMAIDHILSLLIAERDKLNRAIDALGAPVKRRGRPPKSATAGHPAAPAPAKKARKKRIFTVEQREAQALRMKQYWAKRNKAAKKSA